jgi:hypothetical protein
MAQVERLGWMNSGQTPWRQVGQTRQTSPDQGCSASGGLSAADSDLTWSGQTPSPQPSQASSAVSSYRDLRRLSRTYGVTCCANWANLANWAKCMGDIRLAECV